MSADLSLFRQLIIRICDENKKFFGVGCLVSSTQAITCAHVVAKALGNGCHLDSVPSGKVQINRPFAKENNLFITAKVKDWLRLSDLARLQLDEPLTASISFKLSYSMTLQGLRFKAWGGPKGYDKNLIDIDDGIIGDILGNGRYRLDVRKSQYKIEKGCSGAPVVDVTTGQVLGLIAQEDLENDAGSLIPAAHLRQTGWFPEQNAGEGLEPLKVWLNNRFKLCSLERQGIEGFVDYYTGTDEKPMPFAGRSEELRYLDNWLAQNQGRLLLLSGSAGRGKSVLLLHWLAQLIRQPLPDLTILFLPISIRFETSNELEGLRLLHAALCDYFADLRFSPSDKPDTHDYRQKLSEGWDRIANRPNQLYLLVIDGIDESANHWLLNKVLPRTSSANLHVLLSARHLSRETDGKSWFQKLNISGELLELPLLTQSAIADAIIQLGRPLDKLSEQQAFVEQLYCLTDQGDPLLLNLWIGQIWQHREVAPQIKTEQWQQLKPSLAGFYKKWLEDQKKVWENQSIGDVDSSDFNRLMQVLASAYGPLLLKELIRLQEQVCQLQEEKTADIWLSWEQDKLRKVLTTSSRLVIGDGEKKGFSLVHPRLNDYFQTELANEPAYQRQVHEAYLNWGSEVVARLNQNELMPDSCPRYLLHHYTEHVAAAPTTVAHLKPRDVLEKYWLPLLEGGWHQAWEAYEGAWNGFLSDLQRVVQALRQYNQVCYEQGERTAMKLAAEVRCALIRLSIHTLNQNIPAELVVQLVEAGLWSLSRAERVALQFEPEKQVDCLAGLVKVALLKKEDKSRLLKQALGVVKNLQKGRPRSRDLIKLLPHLEGALHQQVLQQILIAVEDIQEGWSRAIVLTELTSQLSGELRQQVSQQALTTTQNIQNDEWSRARALVALAHQLAGESRQQVLQQVLTNILNIQGEWNRAQVLNELAPLLAGELHLLQQALTTALEDFHGAFRAEILIKLTPHLSDELRQQALQQALTDARNILDRKHHAQVLTALASQLVGELRQQVLQQTLATVEEIQEEWPRAMTLNTLAFQFAGEPDLLQRALTVAGNIQDKGARAWALAALASQLVGEQQSQRILRQALADASNILGAENWTVLASQLTGELRKQVLQQALTAAQHIPDEGYCAHTLAKLASWLVSEQRQQVLQQALISAGNIPLEFRAQNLIALAPWLAGEPHWLQQVLQQALTAVESIHEEQECAKILTTLASLLVGEQRQQILQQALTVAENIQDGMDRAKALVLLAPQLDGEQRQKILQQTLIVAENIQNELNRANALSTLALQLTSEPYLLQQALTIAWNIQGDTFARVQALTALASQLVGEQRRQILQRALTDTLSIQYEMFYVEALITLASRLSGEPYLLQQTLTAAKNIQDVWSRAKALTALAPQLTGELCQQVLQQILIDVGNLQNEWSNRWSRPQTLISIEELLTQPRYAEILIALPPLLVEKTPLRKDFLKLALDLSDRKDRITISAKLIQNNPDLLTYSLWADWLNHAPLKRSELFEVTDKLCAAAIQLTGNPQEANEIARAVMDVAKWWP